MCICHSSARVKLHLTHPTAASRWVSSRKLCLFNNRWSVWATDQRFSNPSEMRAKPGQVLFLSSVSFGGFENFYCCENPCLTELRKNIEIFFFNPNLRMCLLILEREERRRNITEREIDGLPSVHSLTGDWTHNLSMPPDQKLNPWPSGVWDDVHPTEPPGEGEYWHFYALKN